MSDFYIQSAQTESDWQQVGILLLELMAFEKSIRPIRKAVNLLGIGPMNYLRDNIVDHNGLCLMAMDGVNIVGFMAGWIESGDGLDDGNNKIGRICDCYIRPEFRRRNIFQRFLGEFTWHFENHAVAKLSIDTLGTNAVMQQVLEKTGFQVHRVIYEKALSEPLFIPPQ